MNYQKEIIANNLKKLRNEKGVLQKHIAGTFGMCVTDRISHWEKGTAIPNIVNLFRLAATYNVLPHELYPDLFNTITEEIREKINSH